MPTTNDWILLKSEQAKKTGLRATGFITYKLLTRPPRLDIWIIVSSNDGSGYFSKEMVPFSEIRKCLPQTGNDKPFPAKVFNAAYIGKSSNNAGFLATILRAEGLLVPSGEFGQLHLATSTWDKWLKQALDQTGNDYAPESMEIRTSSTKQIS